MRLSVSRVARGSSRDCNRFRKKSVCVFATIRKYGAHRPFQREFTAIMELNRGTENGTRINGAAQNYRAGDVQLFASQTTVIVRLHRGTSGISGNSDGRRLTVDLGAY